MWQNSKTVVQGVQNDDKRTQNNSLSVWSFPPRCWSVRLHLLTRNCSEINTFSHRTEAQILVVWEFFSNFANRKRQIRVELWESWELIELRTERWELRGMITVRAGRAYELRTERYDYLMSWEQRRLYSAAVTPEAGEKSVKIRGICVTLWIEDYKIGINLCNLWANVKKNEIFYCAPPKIVPKTLAYYRKNE